MNHTTSIFNFKFVLLEFSEPNLDYIGKKKKNLAKKIQFKKSIDPSTFEGHISENFLKKSVKTYKKHTL